MTGFMEFLAMGGYGAFVWASYGVTAAVLGGLVIFTLRDLRGRRRELDRLERARAARRTLEESRSGTEREASDGPSDDA